MSSCGVPKSGRGSGADWLLIFTEGVRCHSITDFLLLGCLKNCSNLISSPDLEGALRKGLLWRNDLGFSTSFWWSGSSPLGQFALEYWFRQILLYLLFHLNFSYIVSLACWSLLGLCCYKEAFSKCGKWGRGRGFPSLRGTGFSCCGGQALGAQ